MTTDPLTTTLRAAVHAARSAHPAAFASYGPGADIDATFDDASAAAGNEHGYTGAHPSLASADSGAIDVQDCPARPGTAVALSVGDTLAGGDVPAGAVLAFPVAASSAFTRRRVRLTLTDTALLAPPVGPVGHLEAALREAILAGLGDTGAPLVDGEFLESVEVVRVRDRYKPSVEVFRTKAVASWALLDPLTRTLVGEGYANAGEARREAVARAKVGPLSGSGFDPAVAPLEVIKVTRREEGAPFIRVNRDRIRNQIVVKVVVAAEKNPARTKTIGWVFAGLNPIGQDVDVVENPAED